MFSEKWHYRFMEVARLIATWSKDPNTKTGAIVVGPDREIRATGYNGLVRGVNDDIPERMERPTKYDFFEHAERNAVYNACLTGTSLKGCSLCHPSALHRLCAGDHPGRDQDGGDQPAAGRSERAGRRLA